MIQLVLRSFCYNGEMHGREQECGRSSVRGYLEKAEKVDGVKLYVRHIIDATYL